MRASVRKLLNPTRDRENGGLGACMMEGAGVN